MTKKRQFPHFPKGRVVFALTPSKTRLEATFFGSKIRNSLLSYYYIDEPSTYSGKKHLRRLIERIASHSDTFFIDSGIYTLKGQIIKHTASMKGVADDNAAVANRRHLPKIVGFAKRYAKWLTDNDHLYDWAFDLDVDQFLGIDVADQLYQHLVQTVPQPKKIIRIWHATRTFADWRDWCRSGDHVYLAVEGGNSHGRDPHFYDRFVDEAHRHQVRVHLLASTDDGFMKRVPIDSGDSSSWMAGSQYGYVYTPFGKVSFTTRKYHTTMPTWGALSPQMKANVLKWLREHNLCDDWRVLQDSWAEREKINIAYFLGIDKPYKNNPFKRQSFLD